MWTRAPADVSPAAAGRARVHMHTSRIPPPRLSAQLATLHRVHPAPPSSWADAPQSVNRCATCLTAQHDGYHPPKHQHVRTLHMLVNPRMSANKMVTASCLVASRALCRKHETCAVFNSMTMM